MRVQNFPFILLPAILLLASKYSIATLNQSLDGELTTDSQSIAQTQHSQQLSPIPILEKDSQEDTTLQKDNSKEFEQVVTELWQLRKELNAHIELISSDEIKRIFNKTSFLTYILINNFINTSPLNHMQFEQDLSRDILKNRLGLNNETLELSKDLLKDLVILQTAYRKNNQSTNFDELLSSLFQYYGINIDKIDLSENTPAAYEDPLKSALLLFMPDTQLDSFIEMIIEHYRISSSLVPNYISAATLFFKEANYRNLSFGQEQAYKFYEIIKEYESPNQNKAFISVLLKVVTKYILNERYIRGQDKPLSIKNPTFSIKDCIFVSEKFRQLNKHKNALELLNYIKTLSKERVIPSDLVPLYQTTAKVYYEQGHYDEAINNYENLFQFEDHTLNLDDYLSFADSYSEKRNKEEAKNIIGKMSSKFKAEDIKVPTDVLKLTNLCYRLDLLPEAFIYLGVYLKAIKNSEAEKTYQELKELKIGDLIDRQLSKISPSKTHKRKRDLIEEDQKEITPSKKQRLMPQEENNTNQVIIDPLSVLITPVKAPKQRLMLGEADFSFASSWLLKQLEKTKNNELGKFLTATEYRKRESLINTYPSTFNKNWNFLQHYNVKLECEVDATKIHEKYKGRKFSRIHFNFPHDGKKYDGKSLPKIISEFFESAAQLQDIGDCIYMAIPQHNSEAYNQFRQGYYYKLYGACTGAGYECYEKRFFGKGRYSGYQHRQTNANQSAPVAEESREYVFKKIALTEEEKKRLRENKPPRNYRTREGSIVEALPLLETQNDSSEP